MSTKGPLDRIAELEATIADLQRRIKAGQSGDGKTAPDLTQQLQYAQQELRTLRSVNPQTTAQTLYPTMKK